MTANRPEPGALLPCPFCGGGAECFGCDHSTMKLCRVVCRFCTASGHNHSTRADAIAAWNTRAVPALSQRVASLEAALRDARVMVAAWGESACFTCEEASERDQADAELVKDLAAIDAALSPSADKREGGTT